MCGRLPQRREEHEVPAIREKLRPPMCALAGRKMRELYRRTPCRGDSKQPGLLRGKHDDSVTVPRPTTRARNRSQHLRRTACRIDSLELAIGEESHSDAIWGPERIARSISADQSLRRRAIE